MDNYQRLHMINDNVNEDRYKQICDCNEFQMELDTTNNHQVLSYYQHIVKNIEIDRTNPHNSYIMWVFNKADVLEIESPPSIIDGRVSLPDVDMDFQITKRAYIIDYIRNRFGKEKVAQMLTFTRMQGRSALKDVLRAWSACSYTEMNEITKFIPDEAEISDQLQIMKDADKEAGGDGEASIIMWALEHNKEDLAGWAHLDDEGEIQGDLAKQFGQAVRLEGTKRSQSKHAAGLIISCHNLSDVCPMIYDKTTKEMICGMEMNDLEEAGHVKYDLLSIAMLDKVKNWCDLMYYGDFQE